jgi:two-component system nitrogen regulation sensor histidine kinase NtrY
MNKAQSDLVSKVIRKITSLAKKFQLAKRLAFILIILATASAIATYYAITRSSSPFGPDPSAVMGYVLIDLTLLLALAILISRRIFNLLVSRRKEIEGSRLQGRIVLMFSLVSSIPTIIVALFSALFFNYGIQSWFDQRVSTALEESVAVAESYLTEHKEKIKLDAIVMAGDLNRQAYLLKDLDFFTDFISTQTVVRALTEALVIQQGKVIAHSALSFSATLERFPIEIFERADKGEIVLLASDNNDKVRALVKLKDFYDTYLLIGRIVDQKVLNYTESTKGAVNEYQRLKSQISNLQIKFSIIFIAVALLLLLASIWLGIIFASAIAKPISKLVVAAEGIKAGNFSARVKEGPENDEIAILERAFNRMAAQIERQRNDLIEANHQIDARRHFSETVIAGVSAGVIALNIVKKITMINKSALSLLGINQTEAIEKDIKELLPEINELVLLAEHSPEAPAQGEVSLIRGNKKLILLVRVVAEMLESTTKGYVITFDDITALVLAQRTAAWSDVARRIAHEIKNPLTPIHLATERLKRKYSQEVSDSETFIKYTDTISRHVSDITKMVEEFVNFARMPAPIFVTTNLSELIKSIIFSRQCVTSNIEYSLELFSQEAFIECDSGQIGQVLLNLLKNAEESIEVKNPTEGRIKVVLASENNSFTLLIIDNGIGFPKELFERLTEPYTTTKVRGTGLGLAIVKKILDDHNATIEFANNPDGGASVKLTMLAKN